MTGGKLNYGLCQGGPYNNKHFADHREVRRIAIDMHTRKAIPAMVGSASPNIRFGEYRFDGKCWIWHAGDSQ